MYANGRGVKRNYAEALKWWRRAAEQGYASAQFSLGLMYEKGDGVAQDFVEAHKWYLIAASRFPTSDPVNSAIAREFGKSLAARMAPQPVAEAQRRAREWQPTFETPVRARRGR
jgi:TPR repeat protein